MKLLCVGLPLRLRARLQGELPQVDLDLVSSEPELLERLRETAYEAVILRESTLTRSVREVLEGFPSTFHGVVLLIVQGGHKAADLHHLVRTHHVVSILQDPAQPEDVVKSLVVELGLKRQDEAVAVSGLEELAEVWRQHLPTLTLAIRDVEAVLEPGRQSAPEIQTAVHSASRLVNNFGSFGLPTGGLLAREAQRLLEAAAEGHPLRVERLGEVLEALHRLLGERSGRHELPRLVVVSDDRALHHDLDLEARLLNWCTEGCSDLTDLPMRMSLARTRVLVVDTRAAACLRHPRLLDELVADPFPAVLIADAPLPEPTASTLWMETGSSAYRIMLAALRCQLAPTLDRPPVVLVLEHDLVTRDIIERTLTSVDFHVESLTDPLQLWDALEMGLPDLLILGLEMPTLSGMELCRAVRLDDRYRTLPVILTTGLLDSRTRQRAYEAGTDDLLYKPVIPAELRTRVSNRLQRCRERLSHAAPPAQPGRSYTTLDQLILRSLREGMPLLLGVVEVFVGGMRRRHVAQALRGALRGEDVVRPLAETRLLVGLLSPSLEPTRERFRSILQRIEPDARVVFSWMGEENPDFNVALDQALMQLET